MVRLIPEYLAEQIPNQFNEMQFMEAAFCLKISHTTNLREGEY